MKSFATTNQCSAQIPPLCNSVSIERTGIASRLGLISCTNKKTMPRTAQPMKGSEGSIKVGTTGTVGSLMSQELDSTNKDQASSSSQKKPQEPPVSVPCGSNPKNPQQKKISFKEPGGSNSSGRNGHNSRGSPEKSHKPRHITRKKGSEIPILGSDDITIDKKPNNKRADKKGNSYIVEVVDIKCNNPMSSRLKKLGFSKLSGSSA